MPAPQFEDQWLIGPKLGQDKEWRWEDVRKYRVKEDDLKACNFNAF